MKKKPRRAYKEVRLQQLRSFCETARLGSLGAAAVSLGLSQPTVWEQVHALEREFGTQLIESHPRGCRLTDTGRLLAELAVPVVASADALRQAFDERRATVEQSLTVVAPQRVLVEDLPDVIDRFRLLKPRVRLRLVERMTGQVAATVEAGSADLGVSSDREPGSDSSSLQLEPAYDLDSLLVTPLDHPLSRKRRVQLADLTRYPLVNAPEGFTRPEVTQLLRRLGGFAQHQSPVEALSTGVIRHYVARGYGIGLVLGRQGTSLEPRLCERCMSEHFGRASIAFIWRRGVEPSAHARAFADLVKSMLGHQA
jgi:DNA-binding transcriptional LysR family regulator